MRFSQYSKLYGDDLQEHPFINSTRNNSFPPSPNVDNVPVKMVLIGKLLLFSLITFTVNLVFILKTRILLIYKKSRYNLQVSHWYHCTNFSFEECTCKWVMYNISGNDFPLNDNIIDLSYYTKLKFHKILFLLTRMLLPEVYNKSRNIFIYFSPAPTGVIRGCIGTLHSICNLIMSSFLWISGDILWKWLCSKSGIPKRTQSLVELRRNSNW